MKMPKLKSLNRLLCQKYQVKNFICVYVGTQCYTREGKRVKLSLFRKAIFVKKVWWGLLSLVLLVLLASCGSAAALQSPPSQPITSNALNHNDAQQMSLPTPTPTAPPMSIPSQKPTPTPSKSQSQGQGSPSSGCVAFSHSTTRAPSDNGSLAAPYGPAPSTALAQQFATQLFQLINRDRAACGLPAFTWSSTLASGALLHSWNMFNCGFSHTCPDGSSPCQRIANEGFSNQTDCGECIGGTVASWSSITSIQEGMEHEPVTGWHRIHLFSTTLHYIGIGVYIDSTGYAWFTEDLAS